MPNCDHYCRWVPIQTWWHSLTNQEVLGKSTREIQLQKKKILQLHFPLCLISLMSKSIAHWCISLNVTPLHCPYGHFFVWSEINHSWNPVISDSDNKSIFISLFWNLTDVLIWQVIKFWLIDLGLFIRSGVGKAQPLKCTY